MEGDNYTDVIKNLNSELKKVNSWFRENKISLNIQKTHYIIFHRTRIKQARLNNNPKVHIPREKLSNITNTKHLGVIIDAQLNWSDHITVIKISKSIGIISKIRFKNYNYLK